MQKLNILLVDDRPENLMSLEALLTDEEYQIVKANSGEEALKALLKEDFVVILLDVQMSGMDGFETAALIRARERSKHTPIIFVTAFSHGEADILKGYALGAVDYLSKPIVPEILKAKVAGFADLFRMTQQIREQADQIAVSKDALALQLEKVQELNQTMELEIARRINTEKALQQSEKLYRTLATHLPQTAVFLFDLDLRFLIVEGTLLDTRGYTRQDIQEMLEGKTMRETLPANLCDWLEPYWQAGLEGVSSAFEWPVEDMTYSVQVLPVRDEQGQIFAGLGMIQDVTQAKRAQEILQESHDVLELKVQERTDALEQQNHNLALLNEAGQILTATLKQNQILPQFLSTAANLTHTENVSVWLWNEQEQRLYCQGLLRGKVYNEPDGISTNEGVVYWVMQNTQKALVTINPDDDNSSAYPEITMYAPLRVASLLTIPLHAPGGVIGVLQLASHANEAFTHNDESLVETLATSASVAIYNAQLMDKLRTQAADLQAQNEDLDAFSYTVAHDLKNPLNAILGFGALLETRVRSDEESKRYLEMMTIGGQKMNNIIDELLLLARVRNAEVELIPIQMEKIVQSAQQRLQFMINQYEATITAAEYWPEVLGHPQWVEEVWVNYISNAIKYGGRPPIIELGVTLLEDDMVRFWVRDNGVGLKPEQKEQLFAPFTRLNQIEMEGNGLGLSIVRRIIEKLGGAVSVDSTIGQGSVFSFTLPINDELLFNEGPVAHRVGLAALAGSANRLG